MAATISSISASISDAGSGANPHAEVTVTLANGEVFRHVLDGSTALGLTPGQITSMQNTMNVLRNLASTITKSDFMIP